jgi:hypothetical protein
LKCKNECFAILKPAETVAGEVAFVIFSIICYIVSRCPSLKDLLILMMHSRMQTKDSSLVPIEVIDIIDVNNSFRQCSLSMI